MPDPLLEIRNLTVSFAVGGVLLPAVKELTLSLQPNEVVGLVGESGSGKSTALLAVMNYLPGNAVVESGSIVHGGIDLLRADRATLDGIRGRRIAMIYQDPTTALNPAMTVGAQIAEVLTRHLGMDGERARQRTHELLGLVQLDDPPRIAAAYPYQLSGGMQQRVMIAMALSGEPDVLLMDEPTTALDVIVQAHVLELVRSLHRQIRSAIVFVSHNLAAVAQLADRIGVLYAGELMELGPAAQVLDHPSNPYTRGLIAAVPRIGARQLPRGIPGTASREPVRFAHCVFLDRCAFAADLCRATRPELVPLGSGGHVSRCHFASEPSRIGAGPSELAERAGRAMRVTGEGTNDAAPLLEVSGLSVEYRRGAGFLGLGRPHVVRAVREVSFRLPRRRVLAVVGESGSGKSTLARALLRLEPKVQGRIVFEGADVHALDAGHLRAYRRRAQIVFQNPTSSLNPRKRVADIVARPLVLHGVARNDRRRRVIATLRAVGLTEAYLDRFPEQLSGGEKQRVALARAFVTEPLLVVLDEPTTALDVSVQATILELLLEQKERTGCAYLLISHDLAVVRQVADEVMVMRDGEVCESGDAEQIFTRPAHPYTRELLAAVPDLPERPHPETPYNS
jgi:peptide/nickel transport system ATP-binding protein